MADPANPSDPDDLEEGLRWDGDPVDAERARPKLRSQASIDDSEDDDTAPQVSSPLLIVYGILAGAYLLYTVGWVIAVFRTSSGATTVLQEAMYQFGEFLAIGAPAVWFFFVILLTAGRKPVLRVLWLVIGLLVVAPVPFILGGA